MIKFRGKAIYAEEWVECSLIDFPEYKGREIIPAEGTSYLDAIDIYLDTLQVMTTDGWADIADVEVVRKNPAVSGNSTLYSKCCNKEPFFRIKDNITYYECPYCKQKCDVEWMEDECHH